MDVNTVTTGYFATLGVPVRRGRGFEAADHEGAGKVALINERMAHEFFGADWVPGWLLNHWLQLTLITPVMLYTGRPIHTTGWLTLRGDTLSGRVYGVFPETGRLYGVYPETESLTRVK